MTRFNWLQMVCKMIRCHKHQNQYTKKGYLPVSLFLVAGRFSNQSISNMMTYGDKFIKELKY